MQFHLPCFVLAQVRPDSPEDANPEVAIHGFYASSVEARESIPALREQLAADWAKSINGFFGTEIWASRDYKAGRFYVIPTTDAKFKNFFELEEAIEGAALAAWRKQQLVATTAEVAQ